MVICFADKDSEDAQTPTIEKVKEAELSANNEKRALLTKVYLYLFIYYE